MLIGTIAALRRYPVKSLSAQTLESAQVGPLGIEGDRATALVVREGHARTGKEYRGKEHERLHLISSSGEARAAAAERGVRVEAVTAPGEFFDLAPISVLVDRWLDDLSAHVGYRVEWERFRPNLFVRSSPDFAMREADFEGRELQAGTVRLRFRKPIERCVVPTYDLQGGPADPRILRYLAQERNAWMGIYCDVVRAGRIGAGDELAAL